jgi:hypothetical protein
MQFISIIIFSEVPRTGMRIKGRGGGSDSHPSLGGRRKNSNTYILHLLDLGKFKKYIEQTYAAVAVAKNEYNCTFFTFQVGRPR